MYKNVAKNGTVTYRGYCIELITELAKRMKFNYEIYDVAGLTVLILIKLMKFSYEIYDVAGFNMLILTKLMKFNH